jgi:hypothetical protein
MESDTHGLQHNNPSPKLASKQHKKGSQKALSFKTLKTLKYMIAL